VTRQPTYDPDNNVSFQPIQVGLVTRTVEIDDSTNLDVDARGRIIGVERLNGPIDLDTLVKALRACRLDN
jgi:uncharacterized protein YuzE